ncbi:hypothetical protein ACIB24_18090 [Spongisporangium articulatum]|uniref:Phosphotyrosine protein phosphatase I domain-containing protein n=1 Tax=Spongisporangium articulatum TaxID=3362603 RepID=A0ABW8ATP2_9ACTN
MTVDLTDATPHADHAAEDVEGPFRIVVVSAFDAARGPSLQHVLRRHLTLARSENETVVSSAGTIASPGTCIELETARGLLELGMVEDAEQLELHRAHRLSERRLAQADLVLAVGRDERRRAVELRPAVRPVAFTAVEFARLVSALPEPADEPRRLVRQAAGLRAAVRPVDAGEDDLPPMVESDPREHERVLRRIEHTAADVARALSRTLIGAGPHWS